MAFQFQYAGKTVLIQCEGKIFSITKIAIRIFSRCLVGIHLQSNSPFPTFFREIILQSGQESRFIFTSRNSTAKRQVKQGRRK
jgi:hypothetical protein